MAGETYGTIWGLEVDIVVNLFVGGGSDGEVLCEACTLWSITMLDWHVSNKSTLELEFSRMWVFSFIICDE